MNFAALLWWICFFIIAIITQSLIVGLDALVIGLVIALQERRYKDLLWILPMFIILQEGIGSRDFGGMILWYAMIIIVFIIGRWLFEVQNVLFVLLMAICLGCLNFLLVYILAPLQDLVVDIQFLTRESIYQAVFVPFAWWIASITRRWTYNHAEAL